jgi:hypothetical protein
MHPDLDWDADASFEIRVDDKFKLYLNGEQIK